VRRRWFYATAHNESQSFGRNDHDWSARDPVPRDRRRFAWQRIGVRDPRPSGTELGRPAHKNDAYEEILYGIEGVLTWTVDGKPIEVGPGHALCIPRGAVHRFDNFGKEDVKQLAVISPAIMGPAYFREAAEVISASAGGPPDREKMMEVFRRHGMTVAASPLTPSSTSRPAVDE
jgi:mannose-6-phosphate isomerase-like protein (cupin superfamily)